MFWPLVLVSLSLALPAFTQQVSISFPHPHPDYESLLRLLQRARLIPTLNRLNGSAFFAPTNDAIHRHDLWNAVVSDDNFIWMPIPGGSLGSEPQRLRVAARDQGAWTPATAMLLGIDDVLTPPPNLAHLVSQHSSVSYFYKILTPEIRDFLNSTTELTLFLPVDKAFERLYLESEFATADLDTVRWSDTFNSSGKLKTIDGSILDIVVTPDKTSISTAELLHPDIYASNGVLHLVSSLMVDLEITPEKYLLALNCSSFVSLIHSVNLTGLVNDTEAKYTILAPGDDVLSLFGDGDLPEKGSEDLKKLLQYHFIPGTWSPKKLNDGMLLETALIEDGLDGGRQVLSIAVSGGEKKKDDKSIKFGGVGVIGDPIVVNDTLIYFISRPLVPPSDALETVLPLQDLSLFLASVFSASMADKLKTPRTSLLVPHNSATWGSVLLHHTLNTVEYAQSIQNGSRTFATLEGTDVQLEHLKNGSVYISGSGGWDGMKAELFPHDILTQTGVLHEVSDILIPRSVQLTVGKLIKAADATTIATLVTKAGMDWVLNGSAPPPDSIWAEQGFNGVGWTLLCPPDEAFKTYNLTELYADLEGHLIPTPMRSSDSETALNNNRPLLLEDSATYSTLRSPASAYGDVIFRKTDTDDFIVGIKGARGTDGDADWPRVVSWGRSTTGGGTGGVIAIDRLLVPYNPTWWTQYAGPTFVGVGGIILICLFFYGVRAFWRRDFTHATYEPAGGFGAADEDD
ncbi:hypothetical protein C8F04DRAFT_1075757 [Mycena alexandri]|uniref:FAS1 domain-containing protein n=1 Tax=Mycena alexandri TaxID=1745969 RepID=A0AAD6T9L8_9AGAR|nr:hypothetical protein C8F04DRAFT_1075757 [Mycena alexandri]